METDIAGATEDAVGLLFTLPMRDGNASVGIEAQAGGTAFYASYEGWKLFSEMIRSALFKAFYASYEGWKQRETI